VLLVGGILAAAALILPRVYTAIRYQGQVSTATQAPTAPVAVVFGAGLQADGLPSLILADRMGAAAALYHSGKVQTLLLSGDNRFASYNEPQAMYEYGLRLGIPASALVRDYAGRRTYDTCLRARDIFQLRRVLLVTQAYHLDRALLTCDALGLEAYGVEADLHSYPRDLFVGWWVRELPATGKALWDLFIIPPTDIVLGDPIPIADPIGR
jgi:SanA protein